MRGRLAKPARRKPERSELLHKVQSLGDTTVKIDLLLGLGGFVILFGFWIYLSYTRLLEWAGLVLRWILATLMFGTRAVWLPKKEDRFRYPIGFLGFAQLVKAADLWAFGLVWTDFVIAGLYIWFGILMVGYTLWPQPGRTDIPKRNGEAQY